MLLLPPPFSLILFYLKNNKTNNKSKNFLYYVDRLQKGMDVSVCVQPTIFNWKSSLNLVKYKIPAPTPP